MAARIDPRSPHRRGAPDHHPRSSHSPPARIPLSACGGGSSGGGSSASATTITLSHGYTDVENKELNKLVAQWNTGTRP